MSRPNEPARFMTPEESRRVADAIAEAERGTSAEIKLVIVRYCWGDLRDKAAAIFRRHRLHETREHNAVLILLVTANREFLIYGDRGINRRVGADFWWDVRDVMRERFVEGKIDEGLRDGIRLIGEKLAAFFPRRPDDVNEVADDVALDS